MKKIPRITVIVGIILIIGGLVFVWKYKDKESFLGIKLGKKITKISQENFRDSDNDGLADWEEELYKTDLHNPDTDGDGYLDGEEVNSGTNPLIKAPGDKLVFYPLPLGEKYNVTQKVLNDETLGLIIDSYIRQKGEYINDNPKIYSPETFSAFTKQSTITEMARRAILESYSVVLEKAGETASQIPDLFNIEISDTDIKISQDNSREAINFYLSEIDSFLNSDIFFLQEQSLNTLESALRNQDFSQIDRLIKANDEKIEKVKGIIVPSSWKENHKQALKLTLLIRNIFVSLRDIQNDPLKAYVAIQKLENSYNAYNNLIEQMAELAKSQGIDL